MTKLTADQTDKSRKYEKLLQFVSEEKLLKLRAESRQQALVKEVQEAKAERDRVSLQMTTLVDDLNVQRRVSSKGRAVELARCVANRENKWYLANWRVEEDRSGIEEYVGESIQIDFRKLDTAYARATEIQSLQREIATERQKIKDLGAREESARPSDAQPADKIAPLEEAPPHSSGATPNAEDKSLWNRMFE